MYSFKTKKRLEKGIPLRVGGDEVLIIEGIHGLNDALSAEIPQRV